MSEIISFKAIIENAGDGGAFVRVPFDVEQFYGQKRVKIRASIDGEAYRGTLVRMGEPEHLLLILKEIRKRIGKDFGDEVEVQLEEDFDPRIIVVPAALHALLEQNPQAASFFTSLSYSHKKEYVTWITSAKQETIRQERLLKAIEMLTQGKKGALIVYPFFRSLLFKLDPEVAHELTLQSVRLAGSLPPSRWLLNLMFSAPARPVEAFGLSFRNPVGLAAGYDKDGVAIRGLSALGFGHVEIGTITPRPQPGNPKPRVFRLVDDEAVINRMGFPSRGSEYVQMRLNPALNRGLQEWLIGIPTRKKPTNKKARSAMLGINLGKNKDTPNEQAVFDYLALLQSFAPLADYLAINISSPNTPGLRNLQGREALEALLIQLDAQRKHEETRWEKKLPLLVKLAPDLSEKELDEAVGVILDTGMDGIIATNTTLARDGLRSGPYTQETGGLSGKPLRALSDEQLTRIVARVDGRIPVVGVGGIHSPADAKRKLELGATLVQVYTGLIYAGPGLVKEIVREL